MHNVLKARVDENLKFQVSASQDVKASKNSK